MTSAFFGAKINVCNFNERRDRMKKLLLMILICLTLVCAFAVSVSAATCTEHSYFWAVKPGAEGFLGEMSAIAECTECGTTTTDTIPAIFVALGYSSSDSGVSQSYAINRAALAKYEEISREKLDFGVVVATRNAIGNLNPFNADGTPVSEKVQYVSVTDTKYDIFDVVIKGIPEEHKRSAELIFAMYVKAGDRITYIDNCVEKVNCGSRSYYNILLGPDKEDPIGEDTYIANGVRYERMSKETMNLKKHSYWNGASFTEDDDGGTGETYYALGNSLDRKELPLGSIIELSSGWNYRPDAIVDGASANPRPSVTTRAFSLVTPKWWDRYTERRFNISNGKSVDNITEDQIYDVFRIYVPTQAQYEYVKISSVDYLGLEKNAYWRSDLSYDLYTNDATSVKFFATRKFSKDELKTGMMIKIASGWNYRPDGWKGTDTTTSRPNTVTTEIVYISDKWWGSFTERAFNISPNKNVSDYTFEQVDSAFEIYEPVLIER